MNLVCIIKRDTNLSLTLASIKFAKYGDALPISVIICDTWEQGFQQATGYEYGLFVNAGTVFLDIVGFVEELKKYPEQGLVGHIIDPLNNNEYFWLHEQCFVLKLDNYTVDDFAPVTTAVVPIRSDKNIHDDYTPLWLRASGQVRQYSNSKFGSQLINQTLTNNKIVANFSPALRDKKQYLYNESVKQTWLESNKEYVDVATNQLWILNNEPINLNATNKKVICPGSGFYWMLAAQDPDIEEIDIVDISNVQIKFVQELLDNWDGVDYGSFVIKFMQDNNIVHYNLDHDLSKFERLKFKNKITLSRYINEHAPQIIWAAIKTKRINLYNENIVPYVLTNKPTNIDIWLSNILNYKYTFLVTPYEEIEKFQDYLNERKA